MTLIGDYLLRRGPKVFFEHWETHSHSLIPRFIFLLIFLFSFSLSLIISSQVMKCKWIMKRMFRTASLPFLNSQLASMWTFVSSRMLSIHFTSILHSHDSILHHKLTSSSFSLAHVLCISLISLNIEWQILNSPKNLSFSIFWVSL
jgi:hypothetical protein